MKSYGINSSSSALVSACMWIFSARHIGEMQISALEKMTLAKLGAARRFLSNASIFIIIFIH